MEEAHHQWSIYKHLMRYSPLWEINEGICALKRVENKCVVAITSKRKYANNA
jgi:hypothetical protein